jgi:hypothetical protein
MDGINHQSDIFNVTKDQEKQKFILSHTYTDIFNKIPIQNSFGNANNIFNQQNKEKIIINDENDTIKLKVILNYSYQKEYFEFNFPIKIFYNKQRDKFQFTLNDIIDLIYSFANDTSIFLNENYCISYSMTNPQSKEPNDRSYYFIGNFPLDENIKYNIDVPLDGIIYIKLRKKISKIKSLRYEIYEDENEEELDEVEEKEKNDKLNNCKRSKEKRIGYIVKKVFYWKGLRKHSELKMSLKDAAESVGLSKKTLDEYFNQIKEGKNYGFDFNKYKKDKVNVLRAYVKKKKAQEPKDNTNQRKRKKKKDK